MNADTTECSPVPYSHWGLVASEWRKSWRPGTAALFGVSVCFALYGTIASLFVMPLQAEFGWTRGQISFAYTFGLVSALLAPVIGRMSDRFGPRAVILAGIIVTSLCYAGFSLQSGNLYLYYLLYTVLNIFGLCVTGLTFTKVIVSAFEKTRGTALAFSRLGLAAVSALLPLALFPVIRNFGTTGGFALLAALQLAVALPMALFWIPRHTSTADCKVAPGMRLSTIFDPVRQNPKVAVLALAAVCNYAPVVAIVSQLQPLSIAKGLSSSQSVIVVSLIGISAGAGALISGYLVDRFWAPLVAFVLNLIPAVGCLLLLQDQLSPMMIYVLICFLGLGQGVEVDIVAFMISKYFRHQDYSTIYGLVVMVIAIGSAVGTALIGMTYDRTGSYNWAIVACAVSFLLSSLCYLAMGKYPARDTQTLQ